MKQTYTRKYIIIHEPIRDKHRRRIFERKLAAADAQGYRLVGYPTFQSVLIEANESYQFFGTALMQLKDSSV